MEFLSVADTPAPVVYELPAAAATTPLRSYAKIAMLIGVESSVATRLAHAPSHCCLEEMQRQMPPLQLRIPTATVTVLWVLRGVMTCSASNGSRAITLRRQTELVKWRSRNRIAGVMIAYVMAPRYVLGSELTTTNVSTSTRRGVSVS